MSIDIHQFLQNVEIALDNQQYQHAHVLLEYAMKRAKEGTCFSTQVPYDVNMGLDRGRIRSGNEDCVLVVQGVRPSHVPFGLFVVCDGMGGHERGQEAAQLAIQTLLESVLPSVENQVTPASWEPLLVESIQQAHRVIYQQNQKMKQGDGTTEDTSRLHRMGTTMTAVLLVDEVAYVANVGDSRTYLYDHALRKITRDHSQVAYLLAQGLIQEEELYVHPQRNQITRSLGVNTSVEVDSFVVPLQGQEILLLCSDGLWEMTRDPKIEAVLASSWANASWMTRQLLQQANDGGGHDNIGCIVIQVQQRMDVCSQETMLLERAPKGFVHAS